LQNAVNERKKKSRKADKETNAEDRLPPENT
jgi:hypothetical protein